MKSKSYSILIPIFFNLLTTFLWLGNTNASLGQGFNNNEWIFGYCGTGTENNYLSFGKGGTATVQTLPSSVIVGKNNNSLAIDPITGQPLFLTNGELVYDFGSNPLQGSAPGLNGDIDGRQTVASGFLEYDPNGDRLFYIFYISPAGQLQYAVVDMNAPGQAVGNEL